MGKFDLHMHSWYSDDGQYSEKQLVQQCLQQGITMMSITDHNRISANQEAAQLAKENHINYINGIEIDCVFQDTNLHLLGYGFDLDCGELAELEQHFSEQLKVASLKMLEQIQLLGFQIHEEECFALAKEKRHPDIWTAELLAEVLLKKPEYQNHPLLQPYRPDGKRGDQPLVNFYWDYFAQDKPCYVPLVFPTLQQAVELIHRNHGIAIVAHPGVNLNQKEYLLEPLLQQKVDGIEVFSSYHDQKQLQFYHQFAQKNHLLISCGSDYHGKIKPNVQLAGYPMLEGMDLDQIANDFLMACNSMVK